MLHNQITVMPNPKGRLVDVIPTKDNVDYDKVYYYSCKDATKAFKFLDFNRKVYDRNVRKIVKQINDESYGARFIPAIIVDINTMSIIDGQNRYVAFCQAWNSGREELLRVIYADVPKEYIDQLIKLLQEGKKWNNEDYFHRAISNGNQACQEIEDWCYRHSELCMDKSGPNRSYAMAVIYGRRVDKEVKDLSLTITKNQLDYSEKIYSEVHDMFKAIGYRRAAFLEGMAQSWFGIRKDSKAAINFFIDDMGMDFICNNIYEELKNYQPTTKKSDWDHKFGAIINNLYAKYRKAA